MGTTTVKIDDRTEVRVRDSVYHTDITPVRKHLSRGIEVWDEIAYDGAWPLWMSLFRDGQLVATSEGDEWRIVDRWGIDDRDQFCEEYDRELEAHARAFAAQHVQSGGP